MVIGLKYGNSDSSDIEAKNFTRQKARDLISKFEKIHGSIVCYDLIGFNISKLSPEEAKEKLPLLHDFCQKFLETVITFIKEEL